MKKALTAALLVAAACSQPAWSKVQTYTFAGSVDVLQGYATIPGEWGPEPYTWDRTHTAGWEGSWTPEHVYIYAGERFSGTLTFDDAIADGGSNAATISVAFAAGVADTIPHGVATVRGGNFASFTISSTQDEPLEFSLAQAAVPGQPFTLNLAHNPRISAYWVSPNNGQDIVSNYMSGRIDSLVNVSAVPEPTTYAMLLGGLALLGVRARRVNGGRRV